mgnify:CR=1 FL=1
MSLWNWSSDVGSFYLCARSRNGGFDRTLSILNWLSAASGLLVLIAAFLYLLGRDGTRARLERRLSRSAQPHTNVYDDFAQNQRSLLALLGRGPAAMAEGAAVAVQGKDRLVGPFTSAPPGGNLRAVGAEQFDIFDRR